MKKTTKYILFIGSILLIWLALQLRYISMTEGFNGAPLADTIFTCTTFLDFKSGDRWDRFCKAIDTLHTFHEDRTLDRIHKWVVINEYSDSPKEDWATKVKGRYPYIEFIQKGPDQKGQAKSMNIILDWIRPYTLWIHWEEAWETRTPFLEDVFNAMDETDITQIQLTYEKNNVDWMDLPKDKIKCEKRLCRILPIDGTDKAMEQNPYNGWNILDKWPLYSLRPSINRVNDYKNLGTFSEDPVLWPVKFEWDFGRRWYKAGCTKAVLKDGPVWRPGNHKSTYSII